MSGPRSALPEGDGGDRRSHRRARGPKSQASIWNSLEIAKLVVSIMTTLSVVSLGYILTQRASSEAAQTARETAIVQKRVELWDQLGPKLGRLNVALGEEHVRAEDVPRFREEARECTNLLLAYHIYFSEEFGDRVYDYLKSVNEMLKSLEQGRWSSTDANRIGDKYDEVVELARSALGLPS